MKTRHSSHKLLPGRQQFWGKVCGQGECTALLQHCATILQMLMQMEGGAILWTYHKMGLQGQERPRLNAWVCYQSPHLFLASPTCQDSGSTLHTRQTKLWGKDAACHGRGHIPPPRQGGEEFIQEVYGVFLFLARGVDGGLLPTLSALASQQANPMEQTMVL
jgi:hypothetical protein